MAIKGKVVIEGKESNFKSLPEMACIVLNDFIKRKNIIDFDNLTALIRNSDLPYHKMENSATRRFIVKKSEFNSNNKMNSQMYHTKKSISINNEEYYVTNQWTAQSGSASESVSKLVSFLESQEPNVYKIMIAGNIISPMTGIQNSSLGSSSNFIFDIIKDIFSKDGHKQIILTGAPGTGKTYSAKKYVEGKGEYRFVQFHPSYDYSDFVEGLRPVILSSSTNDQPTFVKIDGIFKSFCRYIVKKNIKSYNIEDIYNASKKRSNEGELTPEENSMLEDYRNSINSNKYFFIIDEINRADLSKVFGELMYGLEESYRGVINGVPSQYDYLPTYTFDSSSKAVVMANDVFKNGFFIPENLYIIGTMNDIDRSVEAFDFALRRRFQWVEIKTEEVINGAFNEMFKSKISTSKVILDNIIKNINGMNKVISEKKEFGLSSAYCIGHAYFKNLDLDNPKTSLEDIFKSNIEPLLKEYTRGRKGDISSFIDECRNTLLSGM